MTRRRRRARLKGLVVIGLVGTLAAMMTLGGLADRLLLFPSREPITDVGGFRRELCGNAGHQVEVWVGSVAGGLKVPLQAAPENVKKPAAYVLCFTGNAGRAEFEGPLVAEEWAHQDVQIWAVNYPGYGRSDGTAALKTFPSAALAAYDALAAEAKGTPIYVSGRSIGCTLALYVASRRPVAGVVLHNPPPLQRLIVGRFGWWNLWLLAGPVSAQVPSEMNTLLTAPRVSAPAVFILAGSDSVVPPAYQQLVVSAYGGPRQLVSLPLADHNDAPTDQDLARICASIDRLRGAGKHDG